MLQALPTKLRPNLSPPKFGLSFERSYGGQLSEVFKLMAANDISYQQEIHRKLIHLSSLWIPAVIYFTPHKIAIMIFAICVSGMLTGEVLRSQTSPISRLIKRLFQPMLRNKETGPGFHLSGASYTVIAALGATVFFPQAVAITVLTIMIISDAVAALIGRKWGKTPLLDKSIEGSTAFLASALLCVFALDTLFDHPVLYLPAGLAATLVATLVELFSNHFRFDDNLSIPAFSGLAMWLVLSFV